MATGFKKATVKSSRVPSTQSNFPVYVDLKRLNGGTSMTTAEANSIRVYANESKTTEWAREIVSVDEMHVKVPSMTSTTDIYVDWDGSRSDYGVTDTYGRNAVWSGVISRYHLNDANDSTGTHNLTASNSPTVVDGKIGKAHRFVRTSSQKLEKTSVSGLPSNASACTISAWFKIATSSNFLLVASTGANRYIGTRISSSTNYLIYNIGGNESWETTSSTQLPSSGTWTKVTLVRESSSTSKIYINGELKKTFSVSGISGTPNQINIGSPNYDGDYMDGDVDEVTISSTAFSADWITTEYNNQNDEADFWGSWTDAGGSPAVAKGGILLAW
jgi:hypothetical protein